MRAEPSQPVTAAFQNVGNETLPQILKGSRSRTAQTAAPGGQAPTDPFKRLRESAFSLEFHNLPSGCLSLYSKVLPTLVAYPTIVFITAPHVGVRGDQSLITVH